MKTICTALLLPMALGAQAQAQADNCETIRQQIEARYRAGGVANPALVVLDTGSSHGGRVVGSCGRGSRQIVFTGQRGAAPAVPAAAAGPTTTPATSPAATTPPPPAPTAAPAPPPVDKIPTECKDGSVVIGPNCDDPRAVRMTSAEIAAMTAPASAPAATAAPASAARVATPASKPGTP